MKTTRKGFLGLLAGLIAAPLAVFSSEEKLKIKGEDVLKLSERQKEKQWWDKGMKEIYTKDVPTSGYAFPPCEEGCLCANGECVAATSATLTYTYPEYTEEEFQSLYGNAYSAYNFRPRTWNPNGNFTGTFRGESMNLDKEKSEFLSIKPTSFSYEDWVDLYEDYKDIFKSG